MKKILVTVAMALALAPIVFSQTQAVVKEFKGKVEIRTGTGDWQPVTAGRNTLCPQKEFALAEALPRR